MTNVADLSPSSTITKLLSYFRHVYPRWSWSNRLKPETAPTGCGGGASNVQRKSNNCLTSTGGGRVAPCTGRATPSTMVSLLPLHTQAKCPPHEPGEQQPIRGGRSHSGVCIQPGLPSWTQLESSQFVGIWSQCVPGKNKMNKNTFLISFLFIYLCIYMFLNIFLNYILCQLHETRGELLKNKQWFSHYFQKNKEHSCFWIIFYFIFPLGSQRSLTYKRAVMAADKQGKCVNFLILHMPYFTIHRTRQACNYKMSKIIKINNIKSSKM